MRDSDVRTIEVFLNVLNELTKLHESKLPFKAYLEIAVPEAIGGEERTA